jgi:ATP adenylyltransferase
MLVGALRDEYQPEAFNTGMNLGRPAGAGVGGPQHNHRGPRGCGGTNFMPVLAETKVLPESLEQTYARVYARLHGDRAATP